jgi:hypothetical protein
VASNLILISGGPGLFATGDPEHDQSWANYVTAPLLLTDTATKRRDFEDGDDVYWFIYQPSYLTRWADDRRRKATAVDDVKASGFSSYVDLLESRASARKWHLRWIHSADMLWTKLRSFNDPIRRIVYWGHARDDLWLTITQSGGTASAPDPSAIVRTADIARYAEAKGRDGRAMRLRYPVDAKRKHDWIGCNTDEFAKEWAKRVRVWSQGVEGKIDFKAIHGTGGTPSMVGPAQIRTFDNSGSGTASGTAW